MAIKIEYQVESLDDVMRYFAKDFELSDGRKVVRTEYFVDTAKGQVVFQLTTTDAAEPG